MPRYEKSFNYKFKDKTDQRHIVEGDKINDDVTEGCFNFSEVSEQIGRVLVLPFATNGTEPADERFIEVARENVRKVRELQASVGRVIGRMDLNRRINQIEKSRDFLKTTFEF